MRWMSCVAVFVFGVSQCLAQSPPPLFTWVGDPVEPTPPRMFAVFPVGIDFALLDAAPPTLSLDLRGAGTFVAHLSKWETRANGGYHWIGKTSVHDVVLTVDGTIITGFIRGGPDTFSILSAPNGVDYSYSLLHVNADEFPSDIDPGDLEHVLSDGFE